MPAPSLTKFRLHLHDGSVAFDCEPDTARSLQAALTDLVERFKASAAATNNGTPTIPHPPMEFRHSGAVFLEVFCNPNIWPNPFAAKVLITIKDQNIHLSTEAELTQLRDDLGNYLEQI